uniref:Uncharacterized protein n=1 Tax=Taeniopygia guttata TaxID=59729 RepID=A0A674GC71_TAEGU
MAKAMGVGKCRPPSYRCGRSKSSTTVQKCGPNQGTEWAISISTPICSGLKIHPLGKRCHVPMGGEVRTTKPPGFLGAATEERPTQKLKWLTDTPVWVDQWPLSTEKTRALSQIVKEELAKGHIVETQSPWNSPVFVIKKPGKDRWRLLHDLRKINNVIEDMGSLQPGMPSPSMLPQNWKLAVLDIKDCFFQIPLHPDDAPCFAFSEPSLNRAAPMKRYHWTVLPQGLKCSPTICQWYVARVLSPVRAKWKDCILYHYMDDVLVCANSDNVLAKALEDTISALSAAGFELQKEKVQHLPPWKYLGLEIGNRTITPQKPMINDDPKTLRDLHQLCGSLNWVRPWLGLTTGELSPIFNLLKGGEELDSPRALTQEARAALEKIQSTLADRQAHRCREGLPFRFIILGKLPHLHGLIFQWDTDHRDPLLIIEWVFLGHQLSKSITKPQELMAQLIMRARARLQVLAGCDFACIHLPIKISTGRLSKEILEHLFQTNENLQFSLDSFTGQILINHPGHRLFETEFHLIPKSIQSSEPLKALTVFTDASGGSHKSVITWKDPQTQQWEADVKVVEGSPQVAELDAVVRAFEKFSEPINIVTDSAYVAGVVSRAEHAVLKEVSNPVIFSLLSKLIFLVSHREQPFFVMHVRSHTDLPGFIAEGNRRADALAAPLQLAGQPNILEQAKVSHQLFHQNAPGLVRQFQLRRDQANAIVAACPQCQESTLPTVSSGVNPRGLRSCEVWQTDITHIQEFGRFQHVHVSVDTFSGAVFASAHTGQKTADAKKHLMQAFAALGVPTTIKTDNGPAYISRAFGEFLQEWGVNHRTGIAHSPTGQAVIERTHQTLKKVLLRQRGDIQVLSPQMRLCKALFTINFLNCSFDRPEPPVLRHFKQHQQLRPEERPPVLIRDPDSREIQGPHQLITWGRGYACVSTPSGLRWIPKKWVRPYTAERRVSPPQSNPPDAQGNPTENAVASDTKRRKEGGDP